MKPIPAHKPPRRRRTSLESLGKTRRAKWRQPNANLELKQRGHQELLGSGVAATRSHGSRRRAVAAAVGRAAGEGREATGRPCEAWGTGSKSAAPRFVRFFFLGRDREREREGPVGDGGVR
jgi:hypothetical protein